MVSELFDADAWQPVPGFDFTDITYHRAVDARHGPDRVRPARGAQRVPARRPSTSCTGRSTTPARAPTSAACCSPATGRRRSDGGWAFCSGGDQRIRGKDGYRYAEGDDSRDDRPGPVGPPPHPRGAAAHPLHAEGRHLRRARVGGGRRPQPARRRRPHARQPRSTRGSSRPMPTWRRFDGGFGSAYLARQVGQKFAREIFFLGQEYSADGRAREMGMVNKVVAARRPRAVGARVGRARSTGRARPRSAC